MGVITCDAGRRTIDAVILLLAVLIVVFTSISAPWSVVLLLVACGLEAIEILLLRRWAKRLDRRTKPTTAAAAIVGQSARVVETCNPVGTVHVHGELWQARCDAGAAAGETVTVEALDGLTLVVAPLTRAILPAG